MLSISSYAWNSMGHKLVGQIAYDNLTPKAKKLCNKYNNSFSKHSKVKNFAASAVWMDTLRGREVYWYDSLHYIDIPYARDNTPLPAVNDINALNAIKQAVIGLQSKKGNAQDKGLNLRILTHVVGDIHQPLHTITQVSEQLPKGDLGGNLFFLAKNSIGKNLHQYWDNGGGVLIGPSKEFQVKNKAHQLENKWSCKLALEQKKPEQWIKNSHQLAIDKVYNLKPHTKPGKQYQLTTQNITQKQILFAGCRLAYLLNTALDHA